MAEISINRDYLARLIVRVRGLQARESVVDPNSGSNPTDDQMLDVLQDSEGDLTRRELASEIQGLADRQQAELVALMWVGRGDAEPEEWDATIALARERKTGPTATYLLREPMVGDYWSEGAERLGIAIDLS